jgi:hypothetical protein
MEKFMPPRRAISFALVATEPSSQVKDIQEIQIEKRSD